jgi:hypothetical protein
MLTQFASCKGGRTSYQATQGRPETLRYTTPIFEAVDARFALRPPLYTVVGHVAHAADSTDWFH